MQSEMKSITSKWPFPNTRPRGSYFVKIYRISFSQNQRRLISLNIAWLDGKIV